MQPPETISSSSHQPDERPEKRALPESLRPLFWDCDFDTLSWEENGSFLIRRIVVSGGWEAVQWLRREIGDAGLRGWILERRGRGLSPPQLRFGELILDLDKTEVDRWLAERKGDPWHERTRRVGRDLSAPENPATP